MSQFKQLIFDVGCGEGHITQALRKRGHKVYALDMFNDTLPGVLMLDGRQFPFAPKSVVMLCRPCHGGFPTDTIENAINRGVETILYVGLEKNVEMDLAEYYDEFQLVLKNCGKEKENVWMRLDKSEQT